MMISPETYYEDNLKGKSAREILREKPVHIYGSNAFPYNFDDLLEFLGVDNQDELDDDGDEG